MAQDQQLVDVQAKSGGWTQLTNDDVGAGSTITFQVREGEVEIHATTDATEPLSSEFGIVYRTLQGERNVQLSSIVHLSGADRLWARSTSEKGAKVYVDHA